MDEVPFPRRINGESVKPPPGLVPARRVLAGSEIRLEPLDPARHAASLHQAGHGNETALHIWDYLPYGPFLAEDAFGAYLRDCAAAFDPIHFAICEAATGQAAGMASFMDIQPKTGVIEIGGIWFSPALQRTRGATEALFLMLAHAFDDLGYRRMQWRCNAQNAKSRAAAKRLGFRFEGIWFNHLVFKGRNRDTAWYSILDSEWPAIREAIKVWLDPANFDAEGRSKRSLSAMTAILAQEKSRFTPFARAEDCPMKSQFQMLAAYNDWVNRRLYDAVAALPDRDYRADRGAFFGSLHGTLNHLLLGDRIWLQRFTGEGAAPDELDAILYDDFATLRTARQAEDARIVAYIESLSDADLAGVVRYRSTRNPAEIEQYLVPLLLHFFNHQTHHRGQAHCLLTELTGEAPSFDLLVFQRQTGIGIAKGRSGDFSRPERRPAR